MVMWPISAPLKWLKLHPLPLLLADIITTRISWPRCTVSATHTNSISRALQLPPSRPASTRTSTRVTCSWLPITTAASSAPSWVPTTEWLQVQVNIIKRPISLSLSPSLSLPVCLIECHNSEVQSPPIPLPIRVASLTVADGHYFIVIPKLPASGARPRSADKSLYSLAEAVAAAPLSRRKCSDIPHFPHISHFSVTFSLFLPGRIPLTYPTMYPERGASPIYTCVPVCLIGYLSPGRTIKLCVNGVTMFPPSSLH